MRVKTNVRFLPLLVVAGLLLSLTAVGLAQDEITCEALAPPGVSPTYFIGLGDAYFSQGDYTDAIIAYTCAIEANPDYAPAYVNRGYAHAAQHNDPEALADYERALERDDTSVAAYNNRGVLYTNQGNFGLAITDFTLAITLDPDYAVAYNNRGVVHAAEGNYDLAMADFEQAIALDPDYAAPHASLAAVYSALAMAQYQQYQEIVGPHVAIPGGSPESVLVTIQDSRETGSFAVWLSYLTPAH